MRVWYHNNVTVTSAESLPADTAQSDTPTVGRPPSKLRELIHEMLEEDPEISVGEVEAHFPKHKHVRIKFYSVRAELGLRAYRQNVTEDSVSLLVTLSKVEYDKLRARAPGGRVGDLLLALARNAAEKIDTQ